MGNILAGGCCTKEEEDDNTGNVVNKEPIISTPNDKTQVEIPATIIETKDFTPTDLPGFQNNIDEKKDEEKNETAQESVYDKYQQLNRLGDGSFGTVFKVKNKTTGELFAVKEINKSILLNNSRRKKVFKEINILKSVNNINIVKICDFFEDVNNYYIVTELCDNGDLEEKAKSDLNFCEFVVKVIMYKVFQAVDYLHKLKIVHGDIKRSNIGITKKNDANNNIPSIKDLINEISRNESMQIELLNTSKISQLSNESRKFLKNLAHYEFKLLDFGAAEIFKLRDNEEMLCITGTLGYLAPEVFSGKDTMQKDEWACGILMYNLLTGNSPFDGDTKEEIINEIKNKAIDINSKNLKNKSKPCKDLMFKLLSKNPSLRMRADEALRHEYFSTGILISDISENIDDSVEPEKSESTNNTKIEIKKEVKIIEPTLNDVITDKNNNSKIEVKKVEITVEKVITDEPTKLNSKKEEIKEEKKEDTKPLYRRRVLDDKKEEPKEEIKKEEPKKDEKEKENEKPAEDRKNYSYRRNRGNQESEKKEEPKEEIKKEEPKKEEENSSKRNTYNRRRRGADTEKKEEESKKEETKKEEPKKEEENSNKRNTYNRRRGEDSEKKEESRTTVNPGAANEIKKEIIDYITSVHISRRSTYKFKDVIDQLCKGDTKMQIDKNGFIENFKKAFKDFTDEELNKLFDEIKDKKSGTIDCKTLIDIFSTREKLINASVIKKAFDAIDSFGSGSITWDKVYSQIFRGKKEAEFNSFIKGLGYKNKNDKISLNDFIKALK